MAGSANVWDKAGLNKQITNVVVDAVAAAAEEDFVIRDHFVIGRPRYKIT
jgi:hypothetical protein